MSNIATVLGGSTNTAAGIKSFAAGFRAASEGAFSADFSFDPSRGFNDEKYDETVELAAQALQISGFIETSDEFKPMIPAVYFEIDASKKNLKNRVDRMKQVIDNGKKDIEMLIELSKNVIWSRSLRTLYLPWLRQIRNNSPDP